MTLTRRDWLRTTAGAALAAGLPARVGADTRATPSAVGVVIHSYPNRVARDRERGGPDRIDDPLTFLRHARSLGFSAIQVGLGARDDEGRRAIRRASEEGSVALEGIVRLPKSPAQIDRFRAELATADACGAAIVRAVLLDGRRYETFATADAFRRYKAEAFECLKLIKPTVEASGVLLAIENHKDLRADELIDLLKRIGSERIGVCLDTGNSISLLEDPMEVVEALAPWTFTTHFKDMGVAEAPDGFLLAEVPLGEGYLDLRRIVKTVRAARPDVRFNVEMITRDPLRVPCLTDRYWATFEDLPGRHLARTLAQVRAHAARQPLPRVGELAVPERVEVEEQNVRKCLAYAREQLRL